MALTLILASGLAVISAQAAIVCPPGHNLEDRDGNGLYDYACVADWNGDGKLEIVEDIQAAVAALNDPGPKLVELSAGAYLPPVVSPHQSGILELPSHTTLQGACDGRAILFGFPGTDVTSTQPVVTNVDYEGAGATDVHVRCLEVDGGWRGGNATGLEHRRMGILFGKCVGCSAEWNFVHDTLHTCLYTKNGTDVRFENNVLRRCGNYTGQGNVYSCLYFYASSGNTQDGVLARANTCVGSGGYGISLRRDSTQSTLRNVQIEGNTVSDTRVIGGLPAYCMRFAGADGVSVTGHNACTRTGGITALDAPLYWPNDVGAVRNVTIDDLVVSDTRGGLSAVEIDRHVDGVTIRNVTVDGTDDLGTGFTFANPIRNLVVEDSTFRNCGRGVLGYFPSGSRPDERVTFRRVTVESARAAEGFFFPNGNTGLDLEDLAVHGAATYGIWFAGPLDSATVLRPVVDHAASFGIRLDCCSNAVLIDGATITASGSDAIRLGSDGLPGPDHAGLQILGSTLSGSGGRGIGTDGSTQLSDLHVTGNTIVNVGQSGIDLGTSSSSSSGPISVTLNAVLGFGLAASNPDDRRGITMRGWVTGADISQNTVSDATGAGSAGIYQDLSGIADAHYLCSNVCEGALTTANCRVDVQDPSYSADTDADGVPNACDACPSVSNSTQSDSDHDGTPDACDLNDGLIYLTLPDKVDAAWQQEAGWNSWRLYRGELGVLRGGGEYTQLPGSNYAAARWCNLHQLSVGDTLAPTVGRGFFYLVTGVAASGEGSLGTNSAGVQRPNTHPCF